MKVAYICEPHLGGAFSFFRHMRPALEALGVDFRCVAPVSASQVARSAFAGLEGVDAIELPNDLRAATGALIDLLVSSGHRLVLTLPSCGILGANLACYLPRDLYCVVRVPMMSRGAYAPTAAISPFADRVVAVSDRVAEDLMRHWRVPEHKVVTIFNGVEVSKFPERGTELPATGRFRMLYAGRLSDVDKGVGLLPDVLERVRRAVPNVALEIAGEGPDEVLLRNAFARKGLEKNVAWLGARDHGAMMRSYYEADCFLLPSRLEGCPNAMMEAMAAGCVPVAARIRGSVDRIVENGVSGLLFEVGNPRAMAEAVLALARDRALWAKLSRGARARIAAHFPVSRAARAYADLFRQLAAKPSTREEPLPLNRYQIPRAMLPTWRTKVPVPLKNLLRRWAERLGRSL